MSYLLRITGPTTTREIPLDPSGAEITLGRDPAADVSLQDPEKSVSRKHVAVRQGRDGIEIRVISSVNGVDTSRGPADPGQQLALAAGDHFTLGPYRIELAASSAEASTQPPATLALAASDPFAALLGNAGTPRRGDDPFERPEFAPRPSSTARDIPDPFSNNGGLAAAARNEGPFGDLLGPSSRTAAPGHRMGEAANMGLEPAGQSLNSWLEGGSGNAIQGDQGSSPLDSFLGLRPAKAPRAISPDHVHGIHMPVAFSVPSAPTDTHTPQGPAADVWSDLLHGWDKATPKPAGMPPPNSALQDTEAGMRDRVAPPPNPFEDLDIAIGDEAFSGWPGEAPGSQRVRAAPAVMLPIVQSSAAAAPPANADIASSSITANSAGSWPAFARGLGLPEAQASDDKAAERAGAMVRLLVEGLSNLLAARADLKRELRAEDRTMLSGRDNNPLKLKLSAAELVQYLFATQATGGYMPADRAVQESIAELRVHEQATIAAARSAVEGALRDFEPNRLRKQLVKGKPGIFQVLDNAKLWDAYQQQYEKQSQHMADWLESIFSRHFMPTYSKETERLKTEAGPKPAE